MRTLCFWFGIAAAFVCGWADPAWGYAVVGALALAQIAMLAAPGASMFLLIHYTTVLTYFSLAPALQIAADMAFWDTGLLSAEAHRQALALLLLYMAGIEAARFGMPALSVRAESHAVPRAPASAMPVVLLLGGALAAFAALFVRPDLNFVARGIIPEEVNQPVDYIVYSTVPKLMVAMCFVALAMLALQRRTVWAWCAAGLAFALAALAVNPVNTPRQILLIGPLPLVIHVFTQRRRWALPVLVFGTIAGLGPVLNFISRGSYWDESLTSFPFSPDFDAMFIVAGIIERAPSPELGLGRYLLSAFSFFLPRDLKLFPEFDPLGWPSILANFSQANLSLPPFTTAYFDFGLLGPVLLGLAISAAARVADRVVERPTAVTGSYLVALVLIAAYVPFLRGPILGWGPFAASGVIAAVLAGMLCARAAARRQRHRTATLAPAGSS